MSAHALVIAAVTVTDAAGTAVIIICRVRADRARSREQARDRERDRSGQDEQRDEQRRAA